MIHDPIDIVAPETGPDGPRRRFPVVPFRVLLPNFVTLLATCSGLTAIRFAIENRYELAILAVVVAAILDALDGRLARLLKGTSRFGAELDSLSDFVNFGVVPALILYFFTLKEYRSIGWVVALVLAMAAALRLARFNVMLDDPDKPEFAKNFFVGVPAPAGALLALLPIYLHFIGVPRFPGMGLIELAFVLLVAFLMVSQLPTYAGKTLGRRVPREHVLPIIVLVVLYFVLLATFPFEVLTAMVAGYLAYLPFGAMRYRQLASEHKAALANSKAAEPTSANQPKDSTA